MNTLADRIALGQSEINRKRDNLKMIVNMMIRLVDQSAVKVNLRRLRFIPEDDCLCYWMVDETVVGLWIACYTRATPEEEFVYAWWQVPTDPPNEQDNLILEDRTAGMVIAYDNLDILIRGMMDTYPSVRKKLELIMSAASI